MSMSPRLTRAFQALSTVELDEKSRFGALGEFHMQQVLDDEQLLYVFNPIVPIPGKPGRFNESDFLIYAYGSLFCVEIKNWRGSVYYPPANWAFGARFNGPPRPQQANTDCDTSQVVQDRQGRHGATIHENPLQKTETFISRLKRFLSNIDDRFKKYYIRAAVGFSDVTDISAIHDFDKGMLHTSELASFFKQYGHSHAPSRPPRWLRSAFYRMPTWDVVVTKQNELIRGVLIGRELSFTSMVVNAPKPPQFLRLQPAHLPPILHSGTCVSWKSRSTPCILEWDGGNKNTWQVGIMPNCKARGGGGG